MGLVSVSRTPAESICARLMEEALTDARGALQRGEVPIGCVISNDEGYIVARGSNRTNERKNATAHAEFIALEMLQTLYHNKKVPGKSSKEPVSFAEWILCVTCEPCIMCAAAIVKLGIGTVIYGCTNERFGGCGGVRSLEMYGEGGKRVKVVGGVEKDMCIALLRAFYDMQNPNAPVTKRKRKTIGKSTAGATDGGETSDAGEEQPSSYRDKALV